MHMHQPLLKLFFSSACQFRESTTCQLPPFALMQTDEEISANREGLIAKGNQVRDYLL